MIKQTKEPVVLGQKYKKEFIDSEGLIITWYYDLSKNPKGPSVVEITYPKDYVLGNKKEKKPKMSWYQKKKLLSLENKTN